MQRAPADAAWRVGLNDIERKELGLLEATLDRLRNELHRTSQDRDRIVNRVMMRVKSRAQKVRHE